MDALLPAELPAAINAYAHYLHDLWKAQKMHISLNYFCKEASSSYPRAP